MGRGVAAERTTAPPNIGRDRWKDGAISVGRLPPALVIRRLSAPVLVGDRRRRVRGSADAVDRTTARMPWRSTRRTRGGVFRDRSPFHFECTCAATLPHRQCVAAAISLLNLGERSGSKACAGRARSRTADGGAATPPEAGDRRGGRAASGSRTAVAPARRAAAPRRPTESAADERVSADREKPVRRDRRICSAPPKSSRVTFERVRRLRIARPPGSSADGAGSAITLPLAVSGNASTSPRWMAPCNPAASGRDDRAAASTPHRGRRRRRRLRPRAG